MLYRHFDKRRRLLYVGISEDALRRAAEHGVKPWGHLIVRITVEHFPTRHEAEVAEKAAILAEAPIHNIVFARQRRLPVDKPQRPPPKITITPAQPRPVRETVPLELDLAKHMRDVEREVLQRALRIYGGNRTLAGQRIGLTLRQMRHRMGRLGVKPYQRAAFFGHGEEDRAEPSLPPAPAAPPAPEPAPRPPKLRGKRAPVNLGAYVPGRDRGS